MPDITNCLRNPRTACRSGRCPLNYNPHAPEPITETDDIDIDETVCPEAQEIANTLILEY